jgi:hypothetical protein
MKIFNPKIPRYLPFIRKENLSQKIAISDTGEVQSDPCKFYNISRTIYASLVKTSNRQKQVFVYYINILIKSCTYCQIYKVMEALQKSILEIL